ncbi:MAG: C10 family peptidase [Planctomycetota bacterium]|jgi:hypothetical protein
MKCRNIILAAILVVLQLCGSLWALPTTAYEAEMVVTGWLKADPQPLGVALGGQVMAVETFADDYGEPAYHIVYLHPAGFVIVSADDLVEPIIGFADDGSYDPASENPLGVLVTADINGRVAAARRTFSPLAITPHVIVTETQKKWNYFVGLADTPNGGIELMGMPPICSGGPSDLRVAPFVQSKWGQSWDYDSDDQPRAIYNFYTPQVSAFGVSWPEDQAENYPCGCVATAMAQVMRFHSYPIEPVEPKEFEVTVDGQSVNRRMLRGEGPDGAYNWDDMPLTPTAAITDKQRRAIGALCHDAGIAVGMDYTTDGSGATLYDSGTALTNAFAYDNAVWAKDAGNMTWRQDLLRMMNPNLDAGLPVILGFRDSPRPWRGHAAVCDGYGYNSTTLYHHLNMGWEGQNDCWYNLPDINTPSAGPFDVITRCIYNVFPEGRGEMVSGRILDADGEPVADAEVTAKNKTGSDSYTVVTNSKGIYALRGLDSDSVYAITVDKWGYDFDLNAGYDTELNEVAVGTSRHGNDSTGNRWGIDLVAYSNCADVTIGQGTSAWDYPMNTNYQDSRAQVIYLAAEIGGGGIIKALALDVTKVPDGSMRNWTIRMKHTSKREHGVCSLEATGWTVVYRKNETIDGAGWQSFEFQTPFEYNGTDNLFVDFSYNNSSSGAKGQCRASRPGGKRSVHAHSNSGHGNPLNWSGATSPTAQCSNNVPNVKLMFCGESQVVGADVKLTASDSRTGDHFGCSVAISGDYAIVGAYGNKERRGAAYVFKRQGTSWIEEAKLRGPLWHRAPAEGRFGFSVSISGDYAVVGAGELSRRPSNRLFGNHAAFIFKREGTDWIMQTELEPLESHSNYHRFGCSVSISGNHVIVGSPGDDVACIFKRDNTAWAQQARLSTNIPGRDDFGDVVSMDGDYAIVTRGNDFYRSYGAYIFKREGTNWTQQNELTWSDGRSIGDSIAISENCAAVGAPEAKSNEIQCGTVHIYKCQGASWAQQSVLTALDGEGGDRFGKFVAISGDYLLVGAPDDDDDYAGRDSGSAYIFRREGTNWGQQAKLTAFDCAYDDHFGGAVAIDGDYAIIGAEDDDDNGRESGSVYIFKRIGSNWVP